MAKKERTVTIKPAKGRPMLQWVGKRPLSRLTAFPAQTVETFGENPEDGGRLYHGDNKEVLAHLLANGYRGKIDLIYIDPPFDSGADYVRKVQLRGQKAKPLEGETYSLGEQMQYTDIWANDNYLQFMFERLLILKELLKDGGVFVLHCDWKKAHHLRCLLDEVFTANDFQNEIYWYFYNKMHDDRKDIFPRATNTLLVYAKGAGSTFHRLAIPRKNVVRQLKRVKVDGVLVNLKNEQGELVYQDSDTKTLDNIWAIPLIPPADQKQKTDYPTQKPEALLEILIQTYTDKNQTVLDAFVGSGTTAVAAQRWGRRWIGCDINKGAIHTTSKRIQSTITEQTAQRAARKKSPELIENENGPPEPAQYGFAVQRVNDYDLQIQHNEAVALTCEHLGVTRTRSDTFFDGTLGRRLVKITPFNHPLSPLDLEEVKKELGARPDEQRSIMVVALGKELAVEKWLDDWNRLRKRGDVPNKIEVVELRTDPKYGKFFAHKPATAKVSIKRLKTKLKIEIKDFISPSIIERLDDQSGVLKPRIDDWRAMVDCIMIDPAYNGTVFNVALSDIPEKKADLVQGAYELAPPEAKKATVAVKIIDMLGEEILITKDV